MFSWLTNRASRKSKRMDPWDLSRPLLRWSCGDAWTIRDACGGCLGLAGTGGGKTSGMERTLALAMLKAGFGALVLSAKPNVRKLWEGYCAEAGRLEDLLVFGPGEGHCLNFLAYELNRKGRGAGFTENIVNLLSTVVDAVEGGGSGDGRDEGSYWRRGNRQILRCAVNTLSLAKGDVSAPDLQRLVLSAPISLEQKKSEEWRRSSACFRWCEEADKRPKTPAQQADFEQDMDFLMVEFPQQAEKTRSVHVSGVTTMLSALNRSPLRELFCGKSNLTPEAAEAGRIVLIDMPVLEHKETGLYAQAILKYAFQQSIQRRDVTQSPRPVAHFADEAHHFLNKHDPMFLTTCREARVATVMLTQNVNNFYAALGGNEKARVETASLLGNLSTKLFGANSDPVTNELAASVIGRSRQFMANGNTNRSAEDAAMMGMFGLSNRSNTTAGFSEAFEFDVQPQTFTRLRTGGPENKWLIDAILYQNGKTFRQTGRPWVPVTFQQRH